MYKRFKFYFFFVKNEQIVIDKIRKNCCKQNWRMV